jgi:hypothetical protein
MANTRRAESQLPPRVAILVIAMLLVACSATPEDSSPPTTSSPPPAASVEPLPALDVDAIPWFEAERGWGVQGPIDQLRIMAGRLDGEPEHLALDVPWAFAPGRMEIGRRAPVALARDGTLVYVSDDGSASAIHVTDVDGTDDRVVAELPQLVWTIGLTPEADHAYLVALSRETGVDDGVYRIALDVVGEPVPVMQAAWVLPVAAGILPVAARAFDATLTFSHDGSVLVRHSCGGPDAAWICVVDVLTVDTGTAVRPPDAFPGGLVGVESTWLVGTPECAALECPRIARNLQTTQHVQLPPAPNGSVLVAIDDEPVLVSTGQQIDRRATALVGTNLETGAIAPVWDAPARTEVMFLELEWKAALPADWIAVQVQGAVEGTLAVNVRDGTAVGLPTPPSLQTMGQPQG